MTKGNNHFYDDIINLQFFFFFFFPKIIQKISILSVDIKQQIGSYPLNDSLHFKRAFDNKVKRNYR